MDKCKRKRIVIIAIGIVIILLISVVAIYVFSAVCPNIDPRITRTTGFEIYSMPKRDGKTGIKSQEVLLASSIEMSSYQKSVVYAYVRKIKLIEDKGKPISSYLQAYNDDFVIIRFINGITLYLEPNSSIYSNENTIEHYRLSHDEDDFKIWFSKLRKKLNKYIGISSEKAFEKLLSIQNPQKLKEKANQIDISKNGVCGTDHSQLAKVRMKQYSSDVVIDDKTSLDNQQMGKMLSIVDALAKSDVVYDFDSIEDINYDDMNFYVGLRAQFYLDTLVDKSNNVHLEGWQKAIVISGDFGVDISVDSESIIPLSLESNLSEVLSIKEESYYILVNVKITSVNKSSEHIDKSITMQYKFANIDGNGLIIKSGKLV